jgi:predicted amidohydrolase
MLPELKFPDNVNIIKTAVIIAVLLGLATAIFFMVIQKESFSEIYIVPGSIDHNSDDKTVLYTYGVKSSETGKMDYFLYTYVDKTLLKTRNFSLNQGEIFEERDKITLPPDTQYPVKISLTLTTNSATEEIHFWIQEGK